MDKLWVVTVPGFKSLWIYAETRGKAIAPALRALHEAGYKKYRFTDLKARRDVSGLPPLPSEMLVP